ncbi:hypothetical protein [Burkholderia diffusa]|uniref:hypothetical protein n=1 Tax=Burkholderia diffusa TaxID=488732 RepID=UPI000A75B23C|nr:hypothetical protein [Burkholderia diffusa]
MECANSGCAAVALEVEQRALGHGLLDTTSIYVSPEVERMGRELASTMRGGRED